MPFYLIPSQLPPLLLRGLPGRKHFSYAYRVCRTVHTNKNKFSSPQPNGDPHRSGTARRRQGGSAHARCQKAAGKATCGDGRSRAVMSVAWLGAFCSVRPPPRLMCPCPVLSTVVVLGLSYNRRHCVLDYAAFVSCALTPRFWRRGADTQRGSGRSRHVKPVPTKRLDSNLSSCKLVLMHVCLPAELLEQVNAPWCPTLIRARVQVHDGLYRYYFHVLLGKVPNR